MLTQFNTVIKTDEDIMTVINKPMVINKEDIEKKVWLRRLIDIEHSLECKFARTEDESYTIQCFKEFEDPSSQGRINDRKECEKLLYFTELAYESHVKKTLATKEQRINDAIIKYKNVQENAIKDLVVIKNIIQNIDSMPMGLIKVIGTSLVNHTAEPGDFAKWINEEVQKHRHELTNPNRNKYDPSRRY